jgi:Low-density lipoprotein receptor domain class A
VYIYLFLLEPRKVLPILKTDEPICPEGKLSCGNGECIEKELFCNDKPDCKDESDENACSKYRVFHVPHTLL